MKIVALKSLVISSVLLVFQPGISPAQIVSGGSYHSLSVCTSTNTAYTCGLNNHGQIGNGSTVNTNTLISVNSLSGIMAVAGGSYHSLFLKNDGTVWACGLNDYGQLGDSTNTKRTIAVQVNNLTNIIL